MMILASTLSNSLKVCNYNASFLRRSREGLTKFAQMMFPFVNFKNNELCFSDVLITIRNTLWREKHFSKSANNDDLYQLSEQEVNQLIYQLSLTG